MPPAVADFSAFVFYGNDVTTKGKLLIIKWLSDLISHIHKISNLNTYNNNNNNRCLWINFGLKCLEVFLKFFLCPTA